LALFALFAAGSNVLAADQADPPRSVTVTGDATIYVVPDEVTFTAGVELTHASLDKVREEVDARIKRMLGVAKEFAIDADHVQTDWLWVSPVIEGGRIKGLSEKVISYSVTNQLAIILREPSRASAIVSALLEKGANRIGGVEIRSSKVRGHRSIRSVLRETKCRCRQHAGAPFGTVRPSPTWLSTPLQCSTSALYEHERRGVACIATSSPSPAPVDGR
jgi:uncharacterized protein YggE